MDESNFLLDKTCTLQIKGIAILLVVIGHLVRSYNRFKIISILGSLGVAIFLFISAYGLSKSYGNKNLNNYFKQRYKKVLIPYQLVTLFWIIISYFIGDMYDFKTIIISLIGFSKTIDPTMWYISFILYWYFIFYLTFNFIKDNIHRLIFLLMIADVGFILGLYNLIGELSLQFVQHFYVFPMGVWYALYGENIISKYRDKLLLPAILLSGFICYINEIANSNRVIYPMVSNLFLLIIIVFMVIFVRQYKLKLLFLEQIGKYSYEIYLFEGYFIFKRNIFITIENQYLALLIYLLLTLILAYLLKYIINNFMKINKAEMYLKY